MGKINVCSSLFLQRVPTPSIFLKTTNNIRVPKMKNNPTQTILIIEDDAAVLSAMEKYLKFLGYDLIIARDGMEGIEKIKSGGYDLVT